MRGEASYDVFLGFLRSPIGILLHLVLLAGVIFHVKTWFETLPKTQPKMIVNGKQVPAADITRIATWSRPRVRSSSFSSRWWWRDEPSPPETTAPDGAQRSGEAEHLADLLAHVRRRAACFRPCSGPGSS